MENKISSIIRVSLYKELLECAIRTQAHPAHIHEMERQLDLAVFNAVGNIASHCAGAQHYFNRALAGLKWRKS